MRRRSYLAAVAGGGLLLSALAVVGQAAETVRLESLDLSKMSAGWGRPVASRSVQDKPMSIGGRKFQHGVGTHAVSAMWVDLKGGVSRFTASVGVDDEVGPGRGTVEFRLMADDEIVYRSGVLKGGDAAKQVDVDLGGKETLLLLVRSAGDGVDFDHGDWADAEFQVTGQAPVAIDVPRGLDEPKVILTPKPGPARKLTDRDCSGRGPAIPFCIGYPVPVRGPLSLPSKVFPASFNWTRPPGSFEATFRRSAAATR